MLRSESSDLPKPAILTKPEKVEEEKDDGVALQDEGSVIFNSKSKTWFYLSNFYGGVEENFAAMRFPVLKPLFERIKTIEKEEFL